MKVLLCSGSEKNKEIISDLMGGIPGLQIIDTCLGADARKELSAADDIGFAVISTPLADEHGGELAVLMAEEYSLPVALILSEESYKRYNSALYSRGVTAIRRPVDKKVLLSTFSSLRSAAVIAERLRKEGKELRDEIDEIKLVNRAKALLIKNLNMTEAQAHRYIEKHAMDMRQSRRVIAQNVLKIYYNK